MHPDDDVRALAARVFDAEMKAPTCCRGCLGERSTSQRARLTQADLSELALSNSQDHSILDLNLVIRIWYFDIVDTNSTRLNISASFVVARSHSRFDHQFYDPDLAILDEISAD